MCVHMYEYAEYKHVYIHTYIHVYTVYIYIYIYGGVRLVVRTVRKSFSVKTARQSGPDETMVLNRHPVFCSFFLVFPIFLLLNIFS